MLSLVDARTRAQNPGLVTKIESIANTYRRPLKLNEAEDFLQSANNDLHSSYAKNNVSQQVAERDPETGYLVKEADALRTTLYSKLNDLTGTDAAAITQRYGALTNLQNEVSRRVNVSARQNPNSLAEQIGYA